MKPKYIRNANGYFVKVVEDPLKIKHKNSQDEYEKLIKKNAENIFTVKTTLEKSIGMIQSRILKINLQNLVETIEYYYNRKTSRIHAYLDQKFVQSFKQIKDIMRNRRNIQKEAANNKIINDALNEIKKVFLIQHDYIKEIQEQTHVLKKDTKPPIIEHR